MPYYRMATNSAPIIQRGLTEMIAIFGRGAADGKEKRDEDIKRTKSNSEIQTEGNL